MLILIQESRIVQILVDTLAKLYVLPYRVAYYFVSEGRSHCGQYEPFRAYLFEYDWQAPT